jgi:hypothetical protein
MSTALGPYSCNMNQHPSSTPPATHPHLQTSHAQHAQQVKHGEHPPPEPQQHTQHQSPPPPQQHLGFEDFDDADALMDILGASTPNDDNSGDDGENEMHAIMANFSGKDLSSLYESGMMKAVHMEVQENAKIPNLNPSISIIRDARGYRQGYGYAGQGSQPASGGHGGGVFRASGSAVDFGGSNAGATENTQSHELPGSDPKHMAEKFLGNQTRCVTCLPMWSNRKFVACLLCDLMFSFDLL